MLLKCNQNVTPVQSSCKSGKPISMLCFFEKSVIYAVLDGLRQMCTKYANKYAMICWKLSR